jgi:hypothetical protein
MRRGDTKRAPISPTHDRSGMRTAGRRSLNSDFQDYTWSMHRRLVLLGCCVGMAGPWFEGCSGSRADCAYCDPGPATGPEIVARRASIAAIETAAPCGSTQDPCGVDWGGSGPAALGPSDSISPAPTIDAGWTTDVCARRYVCPQPPLPAWVDGSFPNAGSPCWEAWLNIRADHCLATVISTGGERQSFEVSNTTGECRSFRCRTGTGECFTMRSCAFEISPASIVVSFARAASYDAGAPDVPSSVD